MASIRKVKGKKSTRYQAIVRKRNHELTRTFPSLNLAKSWARSCEDAIEQSTARAPFRPQDWLNLIVEDKPTNILEEEKAPPSPTDSLTDIIYKYIDLVKPSKDKANRLKAWAKLPLAEDAFDSVSAKDLQTYITNREKDGVKPNTIRNDVFTLSAVFAHARQIAKVDGKGGWGMDILNPIDFVTVPLPGGSRERRLRKGEEAAIRKALSTGPDPEEMAALFTILLETGMRLGEARQILPEWFQETAGGTCTITLPNYVTKSNRQRSVVLSKKAGAALKAILDKRKTRERTLPYFSFDTPAIEYRWQMARAKAKSPDLHLHDLRHEALSRMAEKGFTITELQNQSGHATVAILMRYLHANADVISKKMG